MPSQKKRRDHLPRRKPSRRRDGGGVRKDIFMIAALHPRVLIQINPDARVRLLCA
jgi:hypothetical protein